MQLRKQIRKSVLLRLTGCLIMFGGCSSKLHIHPILETDMYIKDNGDICFSEEYFNHAVATMVKDK